MSDRKGFMDDLTGLAGGAMSLVSGIREEVETLVKSRLDDALRRLDLARRDELDAVRELAANARIAQEDAESRLATLETRLAALEARLGSGESGGGEGSNA